MPSLMSGLITLIMVVVGYIWAFKAGKAKERATKSQRIHQAALRAVRERDRLLSDDKYAERVRERFTR